VAAFFVTADLRWGGKGFRLLFFALVLALGCLSAIPSTADDSGCENLKLALERKKQLVADYSDALERYREKSEHALVSLLDHKITDLLEQIVRDEKALAKCSKVAAAPQPEGLSPVKSETNEYMGKSCEELKSLLVQALRKSSPLKRRDKSTFSALSPDEKNMLEEAESERQVILAVIRSKCLPPPLPTRPRSSEKRVRTTP